MILSKINKKPCICASIGNIETSKVISAVEYAINNNYSCVEIRFDLLNDFNEELLFNKYLQEIISYSEKLNFPIIATKRNIYYKDANNIENKSDVKSDIIIDKLSFLKKLIDNGIKTVDIEQDTTDKYLIADFIEFAHSKNSEVILSVHDFNSFIDLEKAMQFYIEASYLKADFFKMAAMIASKQEALDILSICDKINEIRNSDIKNYPEFIIFGMGDKGKLTRILSLNYGSFLAYCSIDNGDNGSLTAPGQLNIDLFNKVYNSCNIIL
ncbi:MAG: type I 3-dehydroquinate dehydratase [bacterium]